MIIDAANLVLGRMATVIAKRALLGEKIDIVNCESAVITGNKKNILEKYKARRDRGIPLKGPYFPKLPDRLVRRAIRGMLPYKQEKGRKAFENIMCYIGTPEKLSGQKTETIQTANVSKIPNLKYVTVKEVTKHLGAKE